MEHPVQFTTSGGKRLYGILHIPDDIHTPSAIVIIITGGPQVRTGSHRLYVQLARYLCGQNIAALRFDYEGMGDSEGDFVGYKHAGPSIASAIEFVTDRFPGNDPPVLWSLCDGSSAAALYGAKYPEQINGLILCNPFVLTDESLAKSTIKHYYMKRLFNMEFLRKLLFFRVDFDKSTRSFWEQIKEADLFNSKDSASLHSISESQPSLFFESLKKFDKPVRIILSTNDIVALNFSDMAKNDKSIREHYKSQKIINFTIHDADHTFTDPEAKKELFSLTLQVLQEIQSTSCHTSW